MHTKKTNNTNKLIQISYHSILTKIQKLQNLKKKKKKLFSIPASTPDTGRYCPKLASTAGTRPVQPVFFWVRNRGSNVSDCWPVRYIPAVPLGTVRNWQPWLALYFNLRYTLKFDCLLIYTWSLLWISYHY